MDGYIGGGEKEESREATTDTWRLQGRQSKIKISNKLGVGKKTEGQMIALETQRRLCLWV